MLNDLMFHRVMEETDGGDDGAGAGSESAVVDAPAPDWRDSLPEDIRADPSLKDIKDVGSLAKGFVHAQKAVGNNVAIPSKDAPQEDWDAFFSKSGRPESADKYDFSKLEKVEGVEIPAEAAKSFNETAHKLGLSQRQAAGLMDYYQKLSGESAGQIAQMQSQDREASVADLRKEFGAAFDERLSQAKDAVKHFGGDQLLQVLDETGLGNNPDLVKAFAKIGKAMGDDELFGSGQETGGGKLTPAEATRQMDALRGDKDFMLNYFNAEKPGHEDAKRKMTELIGFASAGR